MKNIFKAKSTETKPGADDPTPFEMAENDLQDFYKEFLPAPDLLSTDDLYKMFPEAYDKEKEEMIKSSKLYEAPKEEKPWPDSDWD